MHQQSRSCVLLIITLLFFRHEEWKQFVTERTKWCASFSSTRCNFKQIPCFDILAQLSFFIGLDFSIPIYFFILNQSDWSISSTFRTIYPDKFKALGTWIWFWRLFSNKCKTFVCLLSICCFSVKEYYLLTNIYISICMQRL